jgi:hypothetical protein
VAAACCEGIKVIYLIGSLRNPEVPKIANHIREATGLEVFDDWYAAGPEADDKWRDYERHRGRSFREALGGLAAKNVFTFDRTNLERADTAILVLPAGKSGHLELGWILGGGKRGYILIDDPERWDVMYQFATGVFDQLDHLIDALILGEPEKYLTFKYNQWVRANGSTPRGMALGPKLYAAWIERMHTLQRWVDANREPNYHQVVAYKTTRAWADETLGPTEVRFEAVSSR